MHAIYLLLSITVTLSAHCSDAGFDFTASQFSLVDLLCPWYLIVVMRANVSLWARKCHTVCMLGAKNDFIFLTSWMIYSFSTPKIHAIWHLSSFYFLFMFLIVYWLRWNFIVSLCVLQIRYIFMRFSYWERFDGKAWSLICIPTLSLAKTALFFNLGNRMQSKLTNTTAKHRLFDKSSTSA